MIVQISQYIEGNTPTGVGKTRQWGDNSGWIQKHPHGRGEDANILLMRIIKPQPVVPLSFGLNSFTAPLIALKLKLWVQIEFVSRSLIANQKSR